MASAMSYPADGGTMPQRWRSEHPFPGLSFKPLKRAPQRSPVRKRWVYASTSHQALEDRRLSVAQCESAGDYVLLLGQALEDERLSVAQCESAGETFPPLPPCRPTLRDGRKECLEDTPAFLKLIHQRYKTAGV